MHHLWFVPITSPEGLPPTVESTHVVQFDIDVSETRFPTEAGVSGVLPVSASDTSRLYRHAATMGHTSSSGRPERWSQCCSPTMTCYGALLRVDVCGRSAVLCIASSYHPTRSPIDETKHKAVATAMLEAALATLSKPLCRVLSECTTADVEHPKNRWGSRLSDHAVWVSSHALTLRRWATRCARWLLSDSSRLHGSVLDVDGLLTDGMVILSMQELEQPLLQPRRLMKAEMVPTMLTPTPQLVARWILTSARRRHVDPEFPPEPVTPNNVQALDASLRMNWAHLMSLSAGFCSPPSTSRPAASASTIATSAAEPQAVESPQRKVHKGDDTEDSDFVLASEDSGEDVHATDCASEPPVMAQTVAAVGASTEWFFHDGHERDHAGMSAEEPANDDTNVRGTLDHLADGVVAGGDGGAAQSPAKPTSASVPLQLVDQIPWWPSERAPLCMALRERVSLQAHCTTSDLVSMRHRVEGSIQVEWLPSSESSLRDCSPDVVCAKSLENGLPIEGFWRVERFTGDAPLLQSHGRNVRMFRLVVHVQCKWDPPSSVENAVVQRCATGDGSRMSGPPATSSSSSSSECDETSAWCPGRWSWEGEDAAPDHGGQGRTCTLLLVCGTDYSAQPSSLPLATFLFDASGRQALLRNALRKQHTAATQSMLRDAMFRVQQSWTPVDCRGRWLLEQAPAGSPGVALLFKGAIASRIPYDVNVPCAVMCRFHPRVSSRKVDGRSASDNAPSLAVQGRPELDILKFKPKNGTATCGWRNVLAACPPRSVPDNLLKVPLAARVAYDDPRILSELRALSAAATGAVGADPHCTLHVRFTNLAFSISGVKVAATCRTHCGDIGGPLDTQCSVSSDDYSFEFDKAQLR